jgi:hypothetical protein
MSTAVATLDHPVEPIPRLPALVSGGAVRAIVPQDFEGAWRIASAVCKAGMAPRGLDSPEKAMVAILHGLEVGLTPMNALQSIAVINSRPTLWGDGALGLVQASGKMLSHKEWTEGEGDKRKAFCVVVRRNDPEPKTGEFSIADAKKAGLWGKSGPWTQYSDRMLKMRARAFALRDGFSDVLRGLGIAEEVQDTPIREAVREDPPAPPPAPSIVAKAAEPPAPPADEADESGGIVEFITAKLMEAESVDALNEVWDKHVTPIERDLFPHDQDDLMSIFRRREAELA